MNEKELQNNGEIELDLGRIIHAVLDRAWLVVLVSILCAVIAIVGTFFLITPEYKASAMFYVNNNSISVGEASLSISSVGSPAGSSPLSLRTEYAISELPR